MTSPAAWHPDPLGRHEYRYWDGSLWTEHVSDAGQVSRDPLTGAGSAGGAASAAGGTDTASTPTQAAAGPAGQPAGAGQPEAQTTPPAQPQQHAQPPPQPQQQAQPGYVAPQPATQTPPPAGGSNGLAVAALIFGLLSLLVAWIPFIGLLGVFGGFIALLLGLFGASRAKKVANGGGMAVAGAVIGGVAILLGIASTALPVLYFQGTVGDLEAVDDCIEATGNEDACIEEHAPGWLRWLHRMEQLERLDD